MTSSIRSKYLTYFRRSCKLNHWLGIWLPTFKINVFKFFFVSRWHESVSIWNTCRYQYLVHCNLARCTYWQFSSKEKAPACQRYRTVHRKSNFFPVTRHESPLDQSSTNDLSKDQLQTKYQRLQHGFASQFPVYN